MADIGTLSAKLVANASQFDSTLKRSESRLQGFVGFASKLGGGLTGGGFAGVATALPGPWGAAAASAIHFGAKLKEGLDEGMERVNALDRLSKRLGTTTEAMAGLTFSAKLADVEQADLAKGMGIFETELGKAQLGAEDARKSFDKLGLSWEKLGTMTPERAIGEVFDKIKDLPTAFEKQAALKDLFGKSGGAFFEMAERGSKGLREDQAFTYKVGTAASKELADTLSNAEQKIKRWDEAWKGFKTTGWWGKTKAAYAEWGTEVLELFGGDMPKSRDFGGQGTLREKWDAEEQTVKLRGQAQARLKESVADQLKDLQGQTAMARLDVPGAEKFHKLMKEQGATLKDLDPLVAESRKKLGEDFVRDMDRLSQTLGMVPHWARVAEAEHKKLGDAAEQSAAKLAKQVDAIGLWHSKLDDLKGLDDATRTPLEGFGKRMADIGSLQTSLLKDPLYVPNPSVFTRAKGQALEGLLKTLPEIQAPEAAVAGTTAVNDILARAQLKLEKTDPTQGLKELLAVEQAKLKEWERLVKAFEDSQRKGRIVFPPAY